MASELLLTSNKAKFNAKTWLPLKYSIASNEQTLTKQQYNFTPDFDFAKAMILEECMSIGAVG